MSASSYAAGHPWDQYAWLRANDPVHWHPEVDGPGFWAITRYDDIRRISRQPGLFSSAAKGVMLADPDGEEWLAAQRQMMLSMDPPQHDRFKLLVSRGFTPKNAQLLTDRITELAGEIVDDVVDAGECDFVRDIAGRLPSAVIAELMGISRADGERMYELTEIIHTTDDHVVTLERRLEAVIEMLSFGAEVANAKRTDPGDDIASTLVQAEIDGDRLTDGELQWFFLLLINAGGDTTRNLLSAGLQLLFDHPDERARLLADLDALLADRGRGDAALLVTGRELPAHGDGGHRDPRPAGASRGQGGRLLRLRQPGRGRLRQTPTASTSDATRTRTSRSAPAARTCASACTWRGSRARSCCGSS